MQNKLASVLRSRKAVGDSEAARLKAAYDAATTDEERAALLREAKIRLLERQLLEDPEDEQADAA